MRNEIICKECKTVLLENSICDICGTNTEYIVLTMHGVLYHFCNEGHAIKFLADELRKKGDKNEIKT